MARAPGLPFKNYARGLRTQFTDTSYTGGMIYTQKPIASNYNRRLINYDFAANGATIKSRPGLKMKPNALLESVPAGGNLILQTGISDAVFENIIKWRSNSIVGLGDTEDPSMTVKVSTAGVAKLSPGHLYLISNPASEGPVGFTNFGHPENTKPCFKLGDLFHTSPSYDDVLLQKEVRDTTPTGKNYFNIDGFLDFTAAPPATTPAITINVNAQTQEIFISGTTNAALLLHLGTWQNRPNVQGQLRIETYHGTITGAVKYYWGQVGAYQSQVSISVNSTIPQLTPDPGWSYGEAFLVIPSGAVFNNVTLHIMLQTGTVPVTWEPYKPGTIIRPAEYAKINNISFADNYWMQYSPCCYGFDGRFIYITSKIIDNGSMAPAYWPANSNYLMMTNGGRGLSLDDNWNFSSDTITPKKLNPSEATSWGYNMLDDSPYTFENGTSGVVITLTGILPYVEDSTQIELNPRVNQTITLECFYSAATPTDYQLQFEWKDIVSATWTTIATVDPDDGHFRCKFTNPGKDIFIRVTAIKTADSSQEAVIVSGFNFSPTAVNNKFEVYDMLTCKNMMYNNRRLCFYNFPGNENLLFLSDYNDPTYVPYPNNMFQFDMAIKKVIEYQQNWLVFTTTSIYLLTQNSDGLTWRQTLVQSGLEITDINAYFICSIKTFVLFKSGNYLYLVVPSASSAGNLTIAPIYLPIKELLDDLNGFFTETLNDLYKYTGSYQLMRFQTYTTLDEIHLVFSIVLDDGKWMHIDFIYNTMNRCWRIYTFETAGMFLPYIKDITQGPQIMTANPENATQIRSYQFDPTTENINDDTASKYNNIQLLDTGYRDTTSQLKKRFREFQYTIYVENADTLKFGTEFYIDGIQRKSDVTPQGELQIDPEQEGRYILFITDEPIYDMLPNILAPENPLIPEEYWQLDVSDFAEKSMLKVRQSISGKGYTARLILKANNEISHELLNNAWVFRYMNSR